MPRILWVEDDLDQFASVVRGFEGRAEIVTVSDLDGALKELRTADQFDLLLVDNLIDGGRGEPLCLGEDELNPGCKFVAFARQAVKFRGPIVILTFYPPDDEHAGVLREDTGTFVVCKNGKSRRDMISIIAQHLAVAVGVVA